MERINHLHREIAQRETELISLKSELAFLQSSPHSDSSWKWPLSQIEYDRYSRQMIVPNFGLQSQQKLKSAKVLIVGAGGLGCPAAAYLAGAGVGCLGLVDGDVVEVSNLHRQVAHSTARVGMGKVDSAVVYLKELNPTITYRAHNTHLTPQNARSVVSEYDIVLDCTDHPTSRYLISDICVLLHKPLISASAFQTSGQLIALNLDETSPCYRCIFPKPPPPDSVVGCGEGGIMGPVVGVMGVLQALEALKVITTGKGSGGMLLFGDGGFRSVRMRGRRKECFACGDESGLSKEVLETSLDYIQFCGVRQPVKLLAEQDRYTPARYRDVVMMKMPHVLVDVREKEQFELCHIDGSINIPISRFMRDKDPDWATSLPSSSPIFTVCRIGNDSQIAARKLKDMGMHSMDIKGGLKAWKEKVDPSMPFI